MPTKIQQSNCLASSVVVIPVDDQPKNFMGVLREHGISPKAEVKGTIVDVKFPYKPSEVDEAQGILRLHSIGHRVRPGDLLVIARADPAKKGFELTSTDTVVQMVSTLALRLKEKEQSEELTEA